MVLHYKILLPYIAIVLSGFQLANGKKLMGKMILPIIKDKKYANALMVTFATVWDDTK